MPSSVASFVSDGRIFLVWNLALQAAQKLSWPNLSTSVPANCDVIDFGRSLAELVYLYHGERVRFLVHTSFRNRLSVFQHHRTIRVQLPMSFMFCCACLTCGVWCEIALHAVRNYGGSTVV